MTITRSQVKEWLQDEVTRSWFKGIRQKQDEVKEYMGLGGTLGEFTRESTGRAVGRIEGLQDSLDINTEEFIEEDEDASSYR